VIADELERLLRAIVRDEVARALGNEPTVPVESDDAELRRLAIEDAGRVKRAGGAR
jgi:hypothetical protein